MMRGLEEMGLQVEVDGAYGDPHLSTELGRLGRERRYWGVVMHGSSTGKAVVACVVREGRPKVRRRVFQVTAMVVRQGYRGQGLARQAIQRVQTRIGEEVMGVNGGARRKEQRGGYIVAVGLKSCMRREGIGLYRALGWSGNEESWEWSSDEHAAQGHSPVLSEESARQKERKSTARYKEVMPARETRDETGQGNGSMEGMTQRTGADQLDTAAAE